MLTVIHCPSARSSGQHGRPHSLPRSLPVSVHTRAPGCSSVARSLARSLAALGLASAEVRTAIHRYRDCRALAAVVGPSARARVDRRRGISIQ
jgi:hypothetical protein